MAKKVRKTPPTGDLLKEQNRRLFKDERVAQAHAAYIRKLKKAGKCCTASKILLMVK